MVVAGDEGDLCVAVAEAVVASNPDDVGAHNGDKCLAISMIDVGEPLHFFDAEVWVDREESRSLTVR